MVSAVKIMDVESIFGQGFSVQYFDVERFDPRYLTRAYLKVAFRDITVWNVSPMNKWVMRLCDNQNKFQWKGPLVAFRINEIGEFGGVEARDLT
ncbi:hypothetical protein HK098_004280 [Nowakowskiella sp. JEL0407]|nr:hypothetical protein HK098_004280 [Nowakowskiella sp. JEL0407]